MRKQCAWLTGLCLTFFVSAVYAAEVSDQIIEQDKFAVLALYQAGKTNDKNDSNLLGSAFLINPKGYVLTAEHVVGGLKTVWGLLYDGRKVELIKLVRDIEQDLAVLAIVNPGSTDYPYLKLSNDPFCKAQALVSIGQNSGRHWLYQRSKFYSLEQGRYQYVWHCPPFSRGYSGGPLIKKGGEVMGISVAIDRRNSRNNDPNQPLCSRSITNQEIRKFLNRFVLDWMVK